MKKTIIAIFAFTFLLFTSSCNNDYDETENPSTSNGKKELTLIVNSAEKQKTKVSHSDVDGIVSLVWDNNDQILVEVYNGSTYEYETLTLSDGAGTDTGTFVGAISEDAQTINVYYSATLKTDGIDYSTQRQTTESSLTHLRDYDFMSATNINVSNDNIIHFGLVHRGIIFTIPIINNSDVEQNIIGITLSNKKNDEVGSVFAKTIKLNNNDNFDVINTASVTSAVENGIVAAGATYTAYVMVYMDNPSQLSGQKLDIIVHTATGRYTITKDAIAFEAGYRYKINDIELTNTNFENKLYIVGSATSGGYDTSKALALTNNNDGTYSWSGPLMGSNFKFIGQNLTEWGDIRFQLQNAGDNTTFVVNDNVDPQFNLSEEGKYSVSANFKSMTLDVTKTGPFRFIYPIGDATPYQWNTSNSEYFTDVNDDATIIKGELTLGVGYMKFLRAQSFGAYTIHPTSNTTNLSGEQPITILENDEQDYKWQVTESTKGKYHITINLSANTIKFERQGAILPPFGNGEF